ncbi:MAG: hypothetical protein WBM50_07695 [Acidimicrobiales bacterium]
MVEITDQGRIRVPDGRFIEAGAALAHLGIPLDAILDEWEALRRETDDIASRFVGLFETHLAPPNWKANLEAVHTQELAHTLAELQSTAKQVLAAALDASVAKLGRERLGELLELESR